MEMNFADFVNDILVLERHKPEPCKTKQNHV